MGAYEDTSWADLRALTRQRRAEARARPAVLRFSSFVSTEFVGVVECVPAKTRRRRTAMKLWKHRQWREGNRRCAYCLQALTLGQNKPTTATVDHKHPLGLGGDDAAWNWCLACLECNAAKAMLTEAEFRALLAA